MVNPIKPILIDTFPRFLDFWANVRASNVETQVERWESEHMASWPELLKKQKCSFLENGVDWRQVAAELIFPHLSDRLPAMEAVREAILATYQQVSADVSATLGFKAEIIMVIYVGIGCGAGWATR